MRVLVVDDEPTITAVMSEILSDTYEVATASSSKDALAVMDTSVFDVILTDFNMPGMDGGVLANTLAVRHPNTKVIIFTGSDDLESIKTVSGVEHVLRKPINWKTLFAILREYEKGIK